MKIEGETAGTIFENGRNGKMTTNKAFKGIDAQHDFRTPAHFFCGEDLSDELHGAASGAFGVLDPEGVMRIVKPSGLRVFLPTIDHVGSLRTRYPIMPLHEEGTKTYKEMEAIRDLLMDLEAHGRYFHILPTVFNETFKERILTKPLTVPPTLYLFIVIFT